MSHQDYDYQPSTNLYLSAALNIFHLGSCPKNPYSTYLAENDVKHLQNKNNNKTKKITTEVKRGNETIRMHFSDEHI